MPASSWSPTRRERPPGNNLNDICMQSTTLPQMGIQQAAAAGDHAEAEALAVVSAVQPR